MKKILILFSIILLGVSSLFAERLMLIQGTYLQTNRIIENGSDKTTQNYGEFGVNITNFTGKKFGLYFSASFMLPVKMTWKYNDVITPETLESYSGLILGLDALVGPGFLSPITPRFSVLAAAGVHFNGIALSSSGEISPQLNYNLGPGLTVSGLFNLTGSLNLNISAMGAWDVLEFYTIPNPSGDTVVKGGITWSVSAGLGFSF